MAIAEITGTAPAAGRVRTGPLDHAAAVVVVGGNVVGQTWVDIGIARASLGEGAGGAARVRGLVRTRSSVG